MNTKHGMVRTDHILFIAAGAFHVSKAVRPHPRAAGTFSDPGGARGAGEKNEFVRILTEPKGALITQYTALLATEGLNLEFSPDAIQRIAEFATLVNDRSQNIGARRLHTVMEKLLDEISFDAPEMVEREFVIDGGYVDRMLADIVKDEDLSRYIL